MNSQETFGATALVVIRFDADVKALGDKLSSALNIDQIVVQSSEFPPYDEIGSAEVLGFQLWLKASQIKGEFTLRIETEHAFEEVAMGRLYDLSPWLARFLAMMCELDVRPGKIGTPTPPTGASIPSH